MKGIGEPEALKGNLQGEFSRRINEKIHCFYVKKALSHLLVSVFVRTTVILTVIEVDSLQPFQTDYSVNISLHKNNVCFIGKC